MNILFVTYGELSVGSGVVRPIAIIRALAEAGHRVDIISRRSDLPDHPNVRHLEGRGDRPSRRQQLRIATIKASGKGSYDVLHAVDDAVFFAGRIAALRKIRLVYDATRSFTGAGGSLPAGLWKLFPGYCGRAEKRVLTRAKAVLTPCSTLTADLRSLVGGASTVQVEDIPVQSMFCSRSTDRNALLSRLGTTASSVIVCSILPGNRKELRNLLMAVRKVIEAVPGAVFFFKGGAVGDAETMATNLDIGDNCSFFGHAETEEFVSSLDMADATLLFSCSDDRHVHNDVFTLLHAPAPLVAVQSPAYGELLNEQNCIQVLASSESIAEGLLQAIQEPLFSLSIATEGQQLVADKYSFSSFKHKVRMAYHDVLKLG